MLLLKYLKNIKKQFFFFKNKINYSFILFNKTIFKLFLYTNNIIYIKKSKFNLIISLKKIISILFIILFLIQISTINIIKYKILFKQFILIVLIYIITSIFIFLNKEIESGSFNSKIKKFWKRSYIIFWLLELLLFFLFISYFLIHFNESIIFLSIKIIKKFNMIISNIILIESILLSILLYINYKAILSNKNSNNMYIFFILMFLILTIIFFIDFKNFFFISNYITGNNIINNNNFNIKNNNINVKNNVNLFYFFIIFFLKFWHILFIYKYYLFIQNSFIHKKSVGYDILSSNMQNIIFIMFFNYIMYIIYIIILLSNDIFKPWNFLYKTNIDLISIDVILEFFFIIFNITHTLSTSTHFNNFTGVVIIALFYNKKFIKEHLAREAVELKIFFYDNLVYKMYNLR